MPRAIITVHLPTHRRQTLEAYGESLRRVGEVYDQNVGGYMKFLARLAGESGFEIRTDNRDLDPVYTIDEFSHDDKKAARRWLDAAPDLWEWITQETPPQPPGTDRFHFSLLRD